jgi:hypothetical protein
MLIWDCVNFLKNYKNFLHFMLDKRTILLYSNIGVEKHNAAVAQSVERRIGSAEVTGPIPVSSFFCAQKIINSRLYILKKDFLSRIKGTERQTVALFF